MSSSAPGARLRCGVVCLSEQSRTEPRRETDPSGECFAWAECGQKDLLSGEWKGGSFLTDNEENFLRSLLVPRTPTSAPARAEGRGPIPIGVSTHLLSCAVMF